MISDKKLENLKKGDVGLFILPSSKYGSDRIKIIKHFVNKKKYKAIYVSSNKSCETLLKEFKKKNVKSNNIFTIDMVGWGASKAKGATCIKVNSPQSLTETSIALEQAVKLLSGEKIIIIDSISTLLTYNSKSTVIKFVHFLSSKIRSWGVTGVIISVKEQSDKAFLSQMTQFVDDVVGGGKK